MTVRDLTKRIPYRNQKILDSARGESCTAQIPGVCNGNPETVVFAHSPFNEDGKGTGQKADDIFGCYACAACHDYIDGRNTVKTFSWAEVRRDFFHVAMKRTWRRLIEKKVLK